MEWYDYATPEKIQYAAELRKRATLGEQRVWSFLRGRTPSWGFQVPVGGYIADFCCPSWRLILEVDGGSHYARKDYDWNRDRNLEQLGWKTIRLTNTQALYWQKPKIIETILIGRMT